MTAKSEPSIQPIARALQVLVALNQRSYASLHELCAATALPKPTIHRLLATLRAEGFVARDPERGIYRLTAKVQLLSAGFSERSLITEVGREILRAVTREIRWPLALGTLEGTEIVVRYSTMPLSPQAVRATTVNHRHGLLTSAMGKAYLASCGGAERRILVEMMAGAATSPAAFDPALVDQVIAEVATFGFALRRGTPQDDSATMAVPVLAGGGVAGVVSLTMFRRSLTERATAQHLPVLKEVARRIAERLEAAQRMRDD